MSTMKFELVPASDFNILLMGSKVHWLRITPYSKVKVELKCFKDYSYS